MKSKTNGGIVLHLHLHLHLLRGHIGAFPCPRRWVRFNASRNAHVWMEMRYWSITGFWRSRFDTAIQATRHPKARISRSVIRQEDSFIWGVAEYLDSRYSIKRGRGFVRNGNGYLLSLPDSRPKLSKEEGQTYSAGWDGPWTMTSAGTIAWPDLNSDIRDYCRLRPSAM